MKLECWLYWGLNKSIYPQHFLSNSKNVVKINYYSTLRENITSQPDIAGKTILISLHALELSGSGISTDFNFKYLKSLLYVGVARINFSISQNYTFCNNAPAEANRITCNSFIKYIRE